MFRGNGVVVVNMKIIVKKYWTFWFELLESVIFDN